MKRLDDIQQLHEEIHKAYLKDPNFCPFCEHPVIEAGQFDTEGRVAWQWVRCDECDAEWHDVFELVAVEKVAGP